MNAIPQNPLRLGLGEIAEVVACEAGRIMVQAGGRRMAARRAASCLVEPEPGDLVLVGGDLARCYLLAVLERAGTAPLRIAGEGDVELLARGGTVRLVGEEGVEIATAREVRITAEAIAVKSSRAALFIDELSVVGRSAVAHIGRLRAMGSVLESFVDRVMMRARRSVRLIEESDHTRAGSIDLRADATLQAHGETSIVTASTLVRLDGGQIHLG